MAASNQMKASFFERDNWANYKELLSFAMKSEFCWLDPAQFSFERFPVTRTAYGVGPPIMLAFVAYYVSLCRTKQSLTLLIWIGSGAASMSTFPWLYPIAAAGYPTVSFVMSVLIDVTHLFYDMSLGLVIIFRAKCGPEICGAFAVLMHVGMALAQLSGFMTYMQVSAIVTQLSFIGHALVSLAASTTDPNNIKNRVFLMITIAHGFQDNLYAVASICPNHVTMPIHTFFVVPAMVVYWALDSGESLWWAPGVTTTRGGEAPAAHSSYELVSRVEPADPLVGASGV